MVYGSGSLPKTKTPTIPRTESGLDRRRALLSKQSSASSNPSTSSNFAEVAGGTAAECAAIWCCCPCAAIDLIFLTVMKLPAGLIKRALRKKAMKRRIALLQPKRLEDDDDDAFVRVRTCVLPSTWPEKSPSRAISDLEEEMWTIFYQNGFWRSLSERSVSEREN